MRMKLIYKNEIMSEWNNFIFINVKLTFIHLKFFLHNSTLMWMIFKWNFLRVYKYDVAFGMMN